MLFKTGQRSELCLFVNNWDRADCWYNPNDYSSESKSWSCLYFFSRHFNWGDESCVNSSYAHWAGSI